MVRSLPVAVVAQKAPEKEILAAVPEVSISIPAPAGKPLAMLPPAPPKTIKIIGLDSGTKEIPLTH